jgi:hypothetical protein
MNSKTLWRLAIVLGLSLVFGSSTHDAPSAQQSAGGQVAKISAPPEVLTVFFNDRGKVITVVNAKGIAVLPKTMVDRPRADIHNTVLLVKGSHCIWDSGQLWCS